MKTGIFTCRVASEDEVLGIDGAMFAIRRRSYQVEIRRKTILDSAGERKLRCFLNKTGILGQSDASCGKRRTR